MRRYNSLSDSHIRLIIRFLRLIFSLHRSIVTVQSAPRIYCEVREKEVEQPRPGALTLRRKEPAPGLVTVKELVTEQLRSIIISLWKV